MRERVLRSCARAAGGVDKSCVRTLGDSPPSGTGRLISTTYDLGIPIATGSSLGWAERPERRPRIACSDKLRLRQLAAIIPGAVSH